MQKVPKQQKRVGKPFFEQLHYFVDYAHGTANLSRLFYITGNDNYFSDDWDGKRSTDGVRNCIDYAIPQEYIAAVTADTGVLKDGKDFVTNTIRANHPALTRALFSENVKSSGGHIITWALLPTSFVFEHTCLYLRRVPEMQLLELWGREKKLQNKPTSIISLFAYYSLVYS
jgi:hypothetical protein